MASLNFRHVDETDNRRAIARARLAGTNLSTVFRAWLKAYAAGMEAQDDQQATGVVERLAGPPAGGSSDADV